MCVASCNANTTSTYYATNLNPQLTQDPYGCLACDPSCAACNGVTALSCTACPAGKVLRMDHSCQDKCALTSPGQFENSNHQCQFCNDTCRQCFAVATNCTACSAAKNLFLFNNTCLATCPVGFYPETANRTCTPCNPLCAQCTGPSDCTACAAPRFLLGSQCAAACPAGMYGAPNGTRACQRCVDAVCKIFSVYANSVVCELHGRHGQRLCGVQSPRAVLRGAQHDLVRPGRVVPQRHLCKRRDGRVRSVCCKLLQVR